MSGNMFTEKFDAKTLFLSVGVIAVGVFYFVQRYSPSIAIDAKPAHIVEATKLRMEFRGNEAAAHHKYDSKIIEVNGKTHAVSMRGSAPVLSVGVMFTNVDCRLDSSMTEIAGLIRSGSMVRVKGKANAVGSDVYLSPCILL